MNILKAYGSVNLHWKLFEELPEGSSGPTLFMFNVSWTSRKIISVMENVENARCSLANI